MALEMQHERCSELLTSFLAGALVPAEAEAVTRHLESCPECAAERRGLQILASLPAEPLTDIERARLHRALEVVATAPVTTPAPSRRRSFWPRVAPALGAVAALALIAIGAVVIVPNLGGDTDSAGVGTADEADRGLDIQAPALEAAPDAAGNAAAGTAAGPPPDPFFTSAVAFSRADITRAGRSSPFPEYAAAFTAEQTGPLLRELTRELSSKAPKRWLAKRVKRCVAAVTDALPYPLLPAYAAYGTYEKTDALILGFAWTERPTGTLYKFMMWAWATGDCADPPMAYETGVISRN